MKLMINGQEREITAPDLRALLEELGFENDVVATAINGDFVPAEKRPEIKVQTDDRIEILAPMKGG